ELAHDDIGRLLALVLDLDLDLLVYRARVLVAGARDRTPLAGDVGIGRESHARDTRARAKRIFADDLELVGLAFEQPRATVGQRERAGHVELDGDFGARRAGAAARELIAVHRGEALKAPRGVGHGLERHDGARLDAGARRDQLDLHPFAVAEMH